VNWFKRHLNLTWLFAALLAPQFGLIIAAKFLAIDIPLTFINAQIAASRGEFTTGIADFAMIAFNFLWLPLFVLGKFAGCIGERNYAEAISLGFLREGNNAAYFFIWFMLPINAWVLKQKGRSLHWLWLAFFFVPYISVILRNKTKTLHELKIPPPLDKMS
jgi:hypothetical protein